MEENMVSLIVISYNHAAFIDDCMQSILEQTYDNMEIFYMDDASGDESYEKAEQYEELLKNKYHKVQFFHNKENQGVVKNLNTLISRCQGKYLVSASADDFMLPTGIEDMVTYLEEHVEAAMVYTNGIYGDENTRYSKEESYEGFNRVYLKTPPYGDNLFPLLYEREFITSPAVMLRKKTCENVGLFDENIEVEDWDYFIRIALYGYIGYLDKCTVMYRILSTSFSHSAVPHRRIVMKKNELLLLEKYKNHLEDSGKARIKRSYNEAISDACHISNAEYMRFLHEYKKRNKVYITMRNKMKYLLYLLGYWNKK